jgi:hypothetical protein
VPIGFGTDAAVFLMVIQEFIYSYEAKQACQPVEGPSSSAK